MRGRPASFVLIFPTGDTEEYSNPSEAADAIRDAEADVNTRNWGKIVSALACLVPGDEVEFPSGLKVLALEKPDRELDDGEGKEIFEASEEAEETSKSRRVDDRTERLEEIEPEPPIDPVNGPSGRKS